MGSKLAKRRNPVLRKSIGRPPPKPPDKQINLRGENVKKSNAFPAYRPPPKPIIQSKKGEGTYYQLFPRVGKTW